METEDTQAPLTPFQVMMRAYGRPQYELARAIGISAGAVSFWARGGIPPNRVLQLEALTGVSRHVLRPDFYPLPHGAVVRHEDAKVLP